MKVPQNEDVCIPPWCDSAETIFEAEVNGGIEGYHPVGLYGIDPLLHGHPYQDDRSSRMSSMESGRRAVRGQHDPAQREWIFPNPFQEAAQILPEGALPQEDVEPQSQPFENLFAVMLSWQDSTPAREMMLRFSYLAPAVWPSTRFPSLRAMRIIFSILRISLDQFLPPGDLSDGDRERISEESFEIGR